MLRRHIVFLIAIRQSDGDVKTGGPLGAFREEQAMSRHRDSSSPFLSSSSHTTQLHYTTGADLEIFDRGGPAEYPMGIY